MPVRTDIGKISSAIEAGRKAASMIDYGPTVSSVVSDNRVYYGDFHFEDLNEDIFVFGFHKWGDSTKKVYK